MEDHVDRIISQWGVTLPELDTSSMGIFGRMLRIESLLSDKRREHLKKFGFKEGEFDVLATLRRTGAPYRLTPTMLYQTLLVTSGAMTNRLQNLENLGLIKRLPNESDKRSMDVILTNKGLRLIEEALHCHINIQNEVLKTLSDNDKNILMNTLKKILQEN